MTSAVVWVGVDSRGPASAYIATDSRFSWASSRLAEKWDQGRKTFASSRFADIAGYWGDVLFPIVTLSQFFANLDAGTLVRPEDLSDMRFGALEQALRVALAEMPSSQRKPFTVVHVARDGASMAGQFRIRTLSWSQESEWHAHVIAPPTVSSAVRLGGSGAAVTAIHLAKWESSRQGGTSRAVYSAFVEGLRAGSDPFSGGAPQLVGLYRIGAGRAIGTIVGRNRYLYGAPVISRVATNEVEWRNELFERVSGRTRKRISNARQHARP